MTSDRDEPSDENLIALVAQGDREAFSCLMERHQDKVFRLAYKMLGDAEEAEDIAQEVFLRIWSHAGKYIPTAKFTTWLFTVSANLCRSHLRSAWKRFVPLKSRDVLIPANDSSHPEAQLLEQERRTRINNAIQALPPDQRLALSLWRYENLSYQDIAIVMGGSVARIEALLFRAKCSLRQQLLK